MNKYELEKRLRELGIYSDFFQRKELKSLAQMLKENEQLNCILTGVNNANRKMLAVTDRRILIIFTGALGSGEFKVVKREAVKEYWFHKKLLFSDAGFVTEGGESFSFTNTQGSLRKLYEWAMSRPLPGIAPA
jgi:hypothetical protein